jgi:hypothetical protein
MRRTYALKRLLEHGPLSAKEMVDITGWRDKQVRGAISALDEQFMLGRKGRGKEFRYFLKDAIPLWTPPPPIQTCWVR